MRRGLPTLGVSSVSTAVWITTVSVFHARQAATVQQHTRRNVSHASPGNINLSSASRSAWESPHVA